MEEMELSKKFGHWFQTLTDGILKPITDMEIQFIAVTKGNEDPFSLEENTWNSNKDIKKKIMRNEIKKL